MDRDRFDYEVTRRFYNDLDPEYVARAEAHEAALIKRSVQIFTDWDWADRVAAITDDCNALGALLEAISKHQQSLPEAVLDAFDAVLALMDAAADDVARRQLKAEREAL